MARKTKQTSATLKTNLPYATCGQQDEILARFEIACGPSFMHCGERYEIWEDMDGEFNSYVAIVNVYDGSGDAWDIVSESDARAAGWIA